MITWSLVFFLFEWLIRIVMLIVVTRKPRPNTAMAWLMVIFFEPIIGLILYGIFGNNQLPKRRVESHKRLMTKLQVIGRRFREHPNIVRPQLDPARMASVTLAEKLGHMPILGGNDAHLICETDTVIDRIVADVDSAQTQVHMLFYIFADDATGRRIVDALARAVQRGVACRVLIDSVGSRPALKRLAKDMRAAGIELHEALPVGLFRRQMARIDIRNHRKLAIIDGEIAYTGSQNIVDAGYGHKDLAWHDMMIRLTGPIVIELQAVFVGDWYFETGEFLNDDETFPEPAITGGMAIQTLPSGPNYSTENYQRMVVDALHGAHERVIITTPYLVPDEAFTQAMQTAILRGVTIDLIVPARCDQFTVGNASRAYYDDLLRVGVRLHLYHTGLLHAKTMSIDGELAFIGSSNFDIRSFALNFEINLVFYGTHMNGKLRAQQELYLSESILLDADAWASRPALRRIVQNVCKLLSPLL